MNDPLTGRVIAVTLCGLLLWLWTSPSSGQLALPEVQLHLPDAGLPTNVNATLPVAQVRVDARQLRVRELLRQHRAELERDPRGELIVRAEILAFAPEDAALQKAFAAGFLLRRERTLYGLGSRLVVLQAPAGMSPRRALQRMRDLDPDGLYDFNHLYLESGETAALPGTDRISTPAASIPVGRPGVRVGLIDSGIAAGHPALANSDLRSHGCDGAAVPTQHGTAVASILLETIGRNRSAEPRVQLFMADVYCGSATGGAVDSVVAALAWMTAQQVPVVNVSLVGPRNALLERVVALVSARGVTIVAAVGNDGPAAAPLYPAAYPEVIAVTAVDRKRKVLLEAGRGPFVDFAARGSEVSAAAPPDLVVDVRGTSFAAPVVAGLLAASLERLDRAEAASAVHALTLTAVDLGQRGPDFVYGKGLVGDGK